MKYAENCPAWYFVDEAGDPFFYGAGKKVIVGTEGCSRILCLGYLCTQNPDAIREKLASVRSLLEQSKYLKDVPSINKTLLAFHAKNDCPEVRHMVYEALMQVDFSAQVIVARKREGQFCDEFGGSADKFYERLVFFLFRHRLHLNNPTRIVFSHRGNKSRQRSLRQAVESAAQQFRDEYERASKTDIEVETQRTQQEPVLQAADYILWAVQRAFERREMRYFEFLRARIELVCDVYDWEKRKDGKPGLRNFYDRTKNPFHIEKTSPLS